MADPGFDRRVEALFTACVKLGADERERTLDAEPNGAVADRVRALLRHDHPDQAPTAGAVRRAASADEHPATVGPYRIVRPIGEGGFGVVYEAEQAEPVRRAVAVKLIKPGMDSHAVLARFEAERRALAAMNHPCIASVFDAGTTPPDQGARPYFVMELVAGSPVTAYCDERRLGLEDRVRLLARICDAVQHAHTKGVIHRDLKPANVLVADGDDDPLPKVIDFGVAKALDADADSDVVTRQGQVIGTPAYMSPEQAAGDLTRIDTRADIYSLGAILYELLTGHTPHEPTGERALAEIQRAVQESSPVRPSLRLASGDDDTDAIADRRSTDARALAATLRQDLDWVVMKCLDKDPDRRYASANALAADLRRFLGGLPVEAGPPSFSYRASKFVRRNRVAVGFGVSAVVALLVATGVSTGMLVWALQERRNAVEESDRTARMVGALQDLIVGVRAGGTREEAGQLREVLLDSYEWSLIDIGSSQSVREREVERFDEQLDRTPMGSLVAGLIDGLVYTPWQERIEREFASEPVLLADLLEPIAQSAADLGLRRRAIELYERVVEFRTPSQGSDHEAALRARWSLMALRVELTGAEALPEVEALLDRTATVFGADHAQTLRGRNTLASALTAAARYEEAGSNYKAILDVLRADSEDDSGLLHSTLSNYSSLLLSRGESQRALSILDEAIEIGTNLHGFDHVTTLAFRHNRAGALQQLGRTAEAEAEFRAIIDLRQELLGPTHPDTLKSMGNLIHLLLTARRPAEALALNEAVYDARSESLGPDHHDTLVSANTLAAAYTQTGDRGRAIELLTSARERAERNLGDGHPLATVLRIRLGQQLREADRLGAADESFRAAVDGMPGAPLAHPLAYQARRELADLCVRRELWDEAADRYQELLEYHLAEGAAGEARALSIRLQIARTIDGSGRKDEAISELKELSLRMREADHPELADCERILQEFEQEAAGD